MIYFLGDLGVPTSNVQMLAQTYGFPSKSFVFVDYDDLRKNFNVHKLSNRRAVQAIILGASPHKVKGVSERSLTGYFKKYQSQLPPVYYLLNPDGTPEGSLNRLKKFLSFIADHQTEQLPIEKITIDRYEPVDDQEFSFDTHPFKTETDMDTVFHEVNELDVIYLVKYIEKKTITQEGILLYKVARLLDRRGQHQPLRFAKAAWLYSYVLDHHLLKDEYLVDARYRLGLMHYNGRGVLLNPEEALRYWLLNNDHLPSRYMQAFVFKRKQVASFITGKPKDWHLQTWEAIAPSYPLAYFQLAETQYQSKKDSKKGHAYIQKFIAYCETHLESLDEELRYRFAQCFHFGYLVKQDLKRAEQLYRQLIQTESLSKAYYGLAKINQERGDLKGYDAQLAKASKSPINDRRCTFEYAKYLYPININKARKYLKAAADLTSVNAIIYGTLLALKAVDPALSEWQERLRHIEKVRHPIIDRLYETQFQLTTQEMDSLLKQLH